MSPCGWLGHCRAQSRLPHFPHSMRTAKGSKNMHSVPDPGQGPPCPQSTQQWCPVPPPWLPLIINSERGQPPASTQLRGHSCILEGSCSSRHVPMPLNSRKLFTQRTPLTPSPISAPYQPEMLAEIRALCGGGRTTSLFLCWCLTHFFAPTAPATCIPPTAMVWAGALFHQDPSGWRQLHTSEGLTSCRPP